MTIIFICKNSSKFSIIIKLHFYELNGVGEMAKWIRAQTAFLEVLEFTRWLTTIFSVL